MTRDELRAFCDMGEFHRFQGRLNGATDSDAFEVLSYLLAEKYGKTGEALASGRAGFDPGPRSLVPLRFRPALIPKPDAKRGPSK